jgi:16S rRNA (guanine(966)-N(2))-methyltransferase RsmD
MTRIVAGRYGGRRLNAPAGPDTRPTSDRVREALFSSLETAVDLDGARVLDLYAGSGAIGLEALSRGAAHVMLIEHDPKAVRVIRANIATLGVTDAVISGGKVTTTLAGGNPGEPYDVIFADPPYAMGVEELSEALRALVNGGWVAEDAVIVLERPRRRGEPEWVQGLTGERSRRYGETTLWYGRADPHSRGSDDV